MKEKNRAEEWFRAKHDELAETARTNLAAHDLEPGQEAYHLDSLHYATAEQMEAICPTGIDFDRYATLANGSVGYDEADAHWADAAWWDEQARTMIRPDRHQDGRGLFMPVCMTDMTRHQRPTGPAIFSRGLLVSLLQVSKPIAVSTTDDWRKTPAVPSRPWAKGARSERDHPSRHCAIMPCEITPNQ